MRKPIQEELAGLMTPRERIWRAIRQLRTGFTSSDLQAQIQQPIRNNTVCSYLSGLVAGGWLQTVTPDASVSGKGRSRIYSLSKDSFEAPRVDKQGRPVTGGMATLAMWRAMRVLDTFDYADIARAASLGHVQVSRQTAINYINRLHAAGYFRVVQPGQPGRAARYQLVRYTGAHPPAVTRRMGIFDRNLGEFTWQQPEQEVCDGIE